MKKKSIKFEINPKRLDYLMKLYQLDNNQLSFLLNKKDDGEERKSGIISAEYITNILNKQEKVTKNFLFRIDKIFNKGYSWILSNLDAPSLNNSSIFFRKDSFNVDLSFESKKIIAEYEELKSDIISMNYYIGLNKDRIFEKYNYLNSNPIEVSKYIFDIFNNTKKDLISKNILKSSNKPRNVLKNTIRILEQFGIYVFEFIEPKNKKIKTDFEGFFMNPNIIVIKRNQNLMQREIFTLLHEFAHYLINYEEVDKFSGEDYYSSNKIEQWCNSFAFYFLLNKYKEDFDNFSNLTEINDFEEEKIRELSKKTNLSMLAIYTRLFMENKITEFDYKIIQKKSDDYMEKIRIEKELEKVNNPNKKFFAAKPIESTLLKNLVVDNYFNGSINESRVRKILKMKDSVKVEDLIYC